MAKSDTNINIPRHPSDPANADQEIAVLVSSATFKEQWQREYNERGERLRHTLVRVHPGRFDMDSGNGWENYAGELQRDWEMAIDQLSHVEADTVAGVALKLRLLEPFFEDINWCDRLVDVLHSALKDAERLAKA